MQLASRALRLGSSTARYGKYSRLGFVHDCKWIDTVNLQLEDVSDIKTTRR